MKYNEKELARMSEEKSTLEGRLNYKKVTTNSQSYQSVYKERWFKLIDNFLFYFRINDLGIIYEKHAAGVFVLETASIQQELDLETPFAFSIYFRDEPDKKHIFSCMSEKIVATWISRLKCASYEYLRSQLFLLQAKIFSKTGKDPLLMVPRNLGSMTWKPNEVTTGKEKTKAKKGGFICHLEENYMTNVQRSKSTVNILDATNNSNDKSFLENSWAGHSKVERSKTSVQVFPRLNPECSKLSFSDTHFGVSYHRSAPSPPPRKKNSPLLSRNALKSNKTEVTNNDNLCNSIQPPLPPQRKNSPKNFQDSAGKNFSDNSENSSNNTRKVVTANDKKTVNNVSEVNLIEF